MKNLRLIITMLLLAAAASVSGQEPRPAREKVESMKIGFLTDRLNLTPEEAKVFWPVYNKYQDEVEVIRKSRKENLINAKMNFDEMTEKEVEKVIDNEIASRQSELDLLKKFHPQFKQVLPMKKVAKLYKAEEDFKRKLLDLIQEKRGQERRKKIEDEINSFSI